MGSWWTCKVCKLVGPNDPNGYDTGVIENNISTARSTFARVWVNAHTDVRSRFGIADRPQTIVWAFTLSLANVDLAVYGDLAVGREVILNNPRV